MKRLEAGDLVLYPLRKSHADELYAPLQDPRIYSFIPEEPPESLDALRRRYAFLENGKNADESEYWLNWVVYLTGQSEPLGTVQATVRPGANADIAFVFLPQYWGLGLAKRATRAMVNYVFDQFGIKYVTANIDTRNKRSIRMVEASGMECTDTIRNADQFKGQSSDEYVYTMTDAQWAKLMADDLD